MRDRFGAEVAHRVGSYRAADGPQRRPARGPSVPHHASGGGDAESAGGVCVGGGLRNGRQ